MKTIIPILYLFLLISSMSGHNKPSPKPTVAEIGASRPNADAHTPIARFISCVLQDKAGNYWFGTLGDGVCRYDGKSFTWFTVNNGLCDNYVWSIQEDKTLPEGETGIWFGTRNGVCRYDGKSMSEGNSGFTDFSVQNNLTNYFDFLYYINLGKTWQSKPDDLWFGATGGVYQYNGKYFTYFALPETDSDIKVRQANPQNLSNPYTVYCTFRDKGGNLWFGTENRGVCRYDGKSFTWFTDKGLDNGAVRAIYQDKSGTYWFGNNGSGLFRYDGKTLTNFTAENKLSNEDFLKKSDFAGKPGTLARVWSITEDKNGNLWFGTADAGAWRYDGNSLINYTVKDGLKSNAVYDIYNDKTGNLWLATYGGGVCKYVGKSFIYLTNKGF